MRLIDAGELIKNLSDYALQESPTGFESDADKTLQRTIYETIKSCIEAVEAQPTAYDLGGVLNCLEKELRLADKEKRRCAGQNSLQFDSAKGYANGIANAIEYVKEAVMPGEKAKGSQWIPVRDKLPECGKPVVVLLQGQYPEDVLYETAELVDLSTDTKIQGKYWYKKGCGYLQHPAYADGCGCYPGYEVIAWMPLPKLPGEAVQDD